MGSEYIGFEKEWKINMGTKQGRRKVTEGKGKGVRGTVIT